MLITSLLLVVLAQTPAPAPANPASTEAGPALPPNLSPAPDRGWIPLFNGQNLDGWYTFRNQEGKNNDTQHIFKAENGTIHVNDVDPAQSQLNGYLATNEAFRNYRVRVEYKWGTIKLPVPRHPEGLPRDAGLLYHMTGKDQVWPMCVEFQIEEHDTGDVWLLPNSPPNPSAVTTVQVDANGNNVRPPRQPGNLWFQEGGVPIVDRGARLNHSDQYDMMDGWNTVELFTTENNAVHVVNGHINNYVQNLRLPDGSVMNEGKILLQAENNEVFYRNVLIKPNVVDRFGGPDYKILALAYKGAKTPNDVVDKAVSALQKLGLSNNFTVETKILTQDPARFDLTDSDLKNYKSVVFVDVSGDNLTPASQQAFQRFIRAGGGFVGLTAAPAQYAGNWDWYGQLVGGQADAGASLNGAAIKLVDAYHSSTLSLPLVWEHAEAVPHFKANPNTKIHPLAAVSTTADAAGDAGTNYASWCHDFDGGRSFYTALGSTVADYSDPAFLIHILGGIMYASGTDGYAPPGATVLFDGSDTSHWVGKDNAAFSWNFHDGVIEPPPATYPNGVRVMTGDLHTKETYTDFQLHVEFKINFTKVQTSRDPNTNEQARGNSGIYLQGRYENQVLDSYDHPVEGKNDEGAIYEAKDPDVNASLPPEVWQSYDITFHAARWQDGKKIASARVTSYLNGVRVQNDAEIPGPTRSSMLTDDGPAPGPIALQDHLNPVQYRYVWVKPLTDSK